MCIPSIHAVALYPGGLAECICRISSSATLAFPACPIGRLPHQAFRGLVERSFALRPASSRDHQVILSIEGFDEFVASFAASIATGQATLPKRDFHPLKYTRIHGARTGALISGIMPSRCSFLVDAVLEGSIPIRVVLPFGGSNPCLRRVGRGPRNDESHPPLPRFAAR
jgi:hypothetical protein